MSYFTERIGKQFHIWLDLVEDLSTYNILANNHFHNKINIG